MKAVREKVALQVMYLNHLGFIIMQTILNVVSPINFVVLFSSDQWHVDEYILPITVKLLSDDGESTVASSDLQGVNTLTVCVTPLSIVLERKGALEGHISGSKCPLTGPAQM